LSSTFTESDSPQSTDRVQKNIHSFNALFSTTTRVHGHKRQNHSRF